MPTPVRLIDQPGQLAEALTAITDEVIGIDVERADSHRYHRRAALVQVGDADACVLVDPLTIPEPAALTQFCADRLVVLHALENDLVPLEALGVEMPAMADTAVAASMLGLPIGLGDLLEEVLGVELPGDKSKYQRADWEQRPLPQGMVEYAAGDVEHLPALWRALEVRLEEAGRTAWYEQVLAATIEAVHVDNRHWTRTKGSGRLAPEQRAVLRALWEAREELCREHDIAPNRLLHDKTLMSLATEPAADAASLLRRDPQRRRGPITEHAEVLFAAQQAGLEAEPEPRERAGRWSEGQRAAFDALRDLRSTLAEEVGLDAGVVCPSRQLRELVTAEPADVDELTRAAGFLPWQQELLADPLWEAYVEVMSETDTDD